MTKNELKQLKSKRVRVLNADLITPLAQARRLLDARPARITLFPDPKRANVTTQVNNFIRARAASMGVPVVTMSEEQAADYR